MYKFELLPIVRDYKVDFYKDVMDAVETKFTVSPEEDVSKYLIELYAYRNSAKTSGDCITFHITYLKDDFEDTDGVTEKTAISRFLFMKQTKSDEICRVVAYVIYDGYVIESQVYEEESQNG